MSDGQRILAGAMLVFLGLFFVWEKQSLSDVARETRGRTRHDPKTHGAHGGRLGGAIVSPFKATQAPPTEDPDAYPDENRMPLGQLGADRWAVGPISRVEAGRDRLEPTFAPKSTEAATPVPTTATPQPTTDVPRGRRLNSAMINTGNHPTYSRGDRIHLREPAKVSATCPLPELHPDKFATVMGWGVHKSFPSCESGKAPPQKKKEDGGDAPVKAPFVRFSTVSEKAVRKAEPGVTVATLSFSGACNAAARKAGKGKVGAFVFKELPDSAFTRLNSVVDAETRQNELKEQFDAAHEATFGRFVAAKVLDKKSEHGDVAPIVGIPEPYILAVCGSLRELHVREVPMAAQHGDAYRYGRKAPSSRSPRAFGPGTRAIQNVLHIMFDSTSIYAQRRDSRRIVDWLERVNNGPNSSSAVYPFKHHHVVSCCSPGNQIPMYSGVLNGEGDFFVRSEPQQNSHDWLWNIAASRGFRTFWSLDNCPDKSARDYHAFPSVDSRVVAPLCLAGVLLSHKELQCLHGRSVDEHVVAGLESFWSHHEAESKFAVVQFITPHEETEKQLIELDMLIHKFFTRLEKSGELNKTAVVFWSDHGINFGKYASTHDGELEKMFPFAHIVLPRWFASARMHANLRAAQDRLTTPYDLYEAVRSLIYYPVKPPPSTRDPKNPPLPRPQDSHIIASFPKDVTPLNPITGAIPANRSCWDANIPMEFCTCVPWVPVTPADTADIGGDAAAFALKHHRAILKEYGSRCHPVELQRVLGVERQVWPTEYKPKGKDTAKTVWMRPNRDMVKVTYETNHPGSGLFEAVFSVDTRDRTVRELARLDRLDAMKKTCGIAQKVAEQLCVCV